MQYKNKGWFVLYVRSKHEKKTHQLLSEVGVESFLPLVKVKKKWSDRIKINDVPLLPSYVFVNINTSLDFHKVLSVNGVVCYVKFGSEYAVVRDSEIEVIKRLIESNGSVSLDESFLTPTKGEIKTISDGCMKGLKCEVLDHDGSNSKVIVRIDSLSKNIVAIIPIGDFS